MYIDFNRATDGLPPVKDVQKPVIGLSANIDGQTSRLHDAYVQSVLDAGATPLIIPAIEDIEALRQIVATIDGLLLTGGADIDGCYFDEPTLEGLVEVDPRRDAYDFLLLRLAADRCLPIFGICRGMQVINVAFGGGMWQDLPTQFPGGVLQHCILTDKDKPVHGVNIAPGSILHSLFGVETIGVNSRHHQAVSRIAPGFKVTAVSPEGVTEAIEGYPERRIFGVQWHPENMAAEGDDEAMKALFGFFVNEAMLFRRAKAFHRSHLSVDSHCDTPMLFEEHTVDFGRRDPVAKVDIVKMQEGMLDASFVVAYIPQGTLDAAGYSNAFEKADRLLDEMVRQVDNSSPFAAIARTFAEADRLKTEGRKAIFLGVENGYAIGDDLRRIKYFKDKGVSYITLCHNGDNLLCDSAAGNVTHSGLSSLGRDAVREMNRQGVMIDLSHAAASTFYEVLKASSVPVLCTHSSASALCDHRRNLTDDQLRALAAAGGVVQVCIYEHFLSKDHPATIIDVANHIDYIAKVAGIDHVGVGSDFDGGGGVPGCNAANEMINITVELLRRGYTEDQLAKMWGGNLRRVMNTVQSAAN